MQIKCDPQTRTFEVIILTTFILQSSSNSPVWFNDCNGNPEKRSSLWTADVVSGHLKQNQRNLLKQANSDMSLLLIDASVNWPGTQGICNTKQPVSTIIA